MNPPRKTPEERAADAAWHERLLEFRAAVIEKAIKLRGHPPAGKRVTVRVAMLCPRCGERVEARADYGYAGKKRWLTQATCATKGCFSYVE